MNFVRTATPRSAVLMDIGSRQLNSVPVTLVLLFQKVNYRTSYSNLIFSQIITTNACETPTMTTSASMAFGMRPAQSATASLALFYLQRNTFAFQSLSQPLNRSQLQSSTTDALCPASMATVTNY